MAKFQPRKIQGRWRDGYALDLHTLSSNPIGHDEFGHMRFDTTRSEVGELLYKLKFNRDQTVVPVIVEQPMTTVFIGGSGHVSYLVPEVRQRLDTIVEKTLSVLIGDANGADKAVQQYLNGKHYAKVEVFYAGGVCRNNIGNWKRRQVFAETREKTFDFYAAKDRVMSRQATVGLMIWDGKSVGTLLNVLRLLRAKKKAVVYHVPERRFWELRKESEWVPFVSRCDAELRDRVEQKASLEERSQLPNQASLLTEPL